MSYTDNFNFEETIRKKSVVFNAKWFNILDFIIFNITVINFIVCLVLIFRIADLKNPNERFVVYTILPITLVFTLFMWYKKLVEKRLLVIETKLNKNEARQKITQMVKSWQWKVQRSNANYLQATTEMEVFARGKKVIIIYCDNKIYLNVLSDNYKIRMPVLFSDISIKKDIEKQLKNNEG
jgi:hypothetical protein